MRCGAAVGTGLQDRATEAEADVTVDFDIERSFYEKRPELARRIPRVGYAALRAILRERTVRAILAEAQGREGYALVRYLLEYFDIRVRIEGNPPPPAGARWTLVANHPTGGWDAIALFDWLADWRPDSVFLANDILWAVVGLRSLLYPVDVFANSRARLSELARLYASDRTIALFPAGRTARPRQGELVDYPWAKSFVRKSRQAGRTILPVHVSGQNSRRFYRIWRWRQRLGITKTIEMFLLADEMMRRRGQEIVLTIGPPTDAAQLVAEAGDDARAAARMQQVTEALGQRERVV